MARENFNDLQAFVLVAREGSFTRAAVKLGVSQSALSHTIRALEARLGVRLLTRTTRSVAVTEAGDRLLQNIGPRFDEIENELAALGDLRDKPAGTIRITATDHSIHSMIWPKLAQVLPDYPDIKIEIEIVIDYGLTDIVAQRYDIGVRLGDQVAKDMIAVRMSPDMRFLIVASPSYLAGHTAPTTPQELMQHQCINLRLPSSGALYAWELQKGEQALQVRVDGQLTFGSLPLILKAAMDGFGLAYVPENSVTAHIAEGKLVSVMEDWCPTWPGYHLYYANRRSSRALQVVVEALRYRQ
ncbi:LysR family transcriptional regulator [Uliginosibacterium sp. H3]|uniref:LysR family transcriptional regulator n=1 Tax=Uliginosibacterium silvisoli TaxID=3114758 RepID=A0ABU6K2K8_9RHOO|nr:LysR family transcriptional regulator [Uliginosibacterium sp. H3]